MKVFSAVYAAAYIAAFNLHTQSVSHGNVDVSESKQRRSTVWVHTNGRESTPFTNGCKPSTTAALHPPSERDGNHAGVECMHSLRRLDGVRVCVCVHSWLILRSVQWRATTLQAMATEQQVYGDGLLGTCRYGVRKSRCNIKNTRERPVVSTDLCWHHVFLDSLSNISDDLCL